jgi:tetratricopeptide (TPR) repeat protein
MSELRLDQWIMPGADLGPENPLPPLPPQRELHIAEPNDAIPADMQRNMAYGHLPNMLPYTMQDGFTRERQPKAFRTAVLENNILRATFLLEFGGRLWSLVHKPSGQELLSVNPIFQPANLALRKAWFSGGVEWNIGTVGHSPLTCSPIFAARVERDDGIPILRMYEWERIRQVPFQIDACLPPGSPLLLIYVRILNPHAFTIPMYWWSNMAVPESADTRVVVPAESAYSYDYDEAGLQIIPVPEYDGRDITYSTRSQRAIDYFFHVPDGQTPWIAALDGDGQGLVQVSAPRLKGRKLFLWGTGTGGQRWQNWLSEPGNAYIEIQAGLARTQLEHLPMPANTAWSWLEGYGRLVADPAAIHGTDWGGAQHAVDERLADLVRDAGFQAEYERLQAYADHPPTELLHRGSGWGALEAIRREMSNEPPFCSTGLLFDRDSLGDEQQPWLHLLEHGHFPDSSPDSLPIGYMIQPAWRDRLEHAAASNQPMDWFAWLQLGLLRHHAEDMDGAQHAWEQSLTCTRTAWALRNLAILKLHADQHAAAVQLLMEAYQLRPDLIPLLIELGQALIQTNQAARWLDIIADLSTPMRAHGRIQLMEAQAALMTGDLARAERILMAPLIIDDLREGETTLTGLWVQLQAQRSGYAGPFDEVLSARILHESPLPPALDFRVHTTA